MPKTDIDFHKLYDHFVTELERELGQKEDTGIHAIMGFEFGSPPDVLLFNHAPKVDGTFYVTSDLLFCEQQPKNSLGRYEVAICLAEKRKWAQHILFKLSRATLTETFDVGDTVDITAWVEDGCTVKGLLLAKLVSFQFGGLPFGTLLCVGITRAELDYALAHDSQELLALLKSSGVFPRTDLQHTQVV